MAPRTLIVQGIVTLIPRKPLWSRSKTLLCKMSQYCQSHRSWLHEAASGPFASRKVSISLPIETPMMCSAPSIFINSRLHAHIWSSACLLHDISVPTSTLALLSRTQVEKSSQICERVSQSPQAGSQGFRRRRVVTVSLTVFGQAPSSLSGHSLKLVSSTQRPFAEILDTVEIR